MRGGRAGPPGGMAGPGRGGPMGKPGGNMEGDRWGKRALPPPPPGSGGGAIAGLPALHKTDNKFKVRLDYVVKVVPHWISQVWYKIVKISIFGKLFELLGCAIWQVGVCHLARNYAGAMLQRCSADNVVAASMWLVM